MPEGIRLLPLKYNQSIQAIQVHINSSIYVQVNHKYEWDLVRIKAEPKDILKTIFNQLVGKVKVLNTKVYVLSTGTD